MNKAAIYETGDGYSLLRTIDAVKRYFYERDIIGQIVKHVDLYTFETDSDYSFCECDGTLKIHGNALKMSLSAWRPIYFVCKFKNNMYLTIDYSADHGIYVKYDDEITLQQGMIHIDPNEYGYIFNHLIGEKLMGVSMPVDVVIQQSGGLLNCIEELEYFYLDFSGRDYNPNFGTVYYVDEKDAFSDSVGFYCDMPYYVSIINYYTDREIDYLVPVKKQNKGGK